MDLKAISLSEIEETFFMHESALRGIIIVNRSISDRLVISDVDYLTILWILVTENQKLRMYDIIRLKFNSFLGNSIISNVRNQCHYQFKIVIYAYY